MTLSEQAQAIKPYFWARQRPDLRLRLIAALGCLVLAKLSNLATPWFLGLAIDRLNGDEVLPVWALGAVGLVVVYVITRLLSLIFLEVMEVLFTYVSQHAIRVLALKTFAHLHQLPLSFHLSRHTGSLDRLIDRGTKAIDFLLRYVVFNIGPTLIELVLVSMIVWITFGGVYALIITGTVVFYVLLTLRITIWRLRFRREMNEADNAVAGRMVDSFVNVENVRLFNNEKYETGQVDLGLASYERAANQSRLSLMYLNLSQTMIVLSGVIVLLVLAAFDVQLGALTVGGFVTLNTYILQAFTPLNLLGWIYRQIRQSLIDMESLFDILDESGESDPANSTDKLDNSTITFDDVHFSYDPSRPTLSGISFIVEPGQTVAIVGETGGGKTTIGKLLLKIIQPNHGSIYIGGKDTKELSRGAVRDAVGVVPQDTVLFNDALSNNVRYGRVDASDQEVTRALEVSGLREFVASLPEGLDTQVGARGLKLSGGEKQRIAIARVVLKNPPILLLDEATSSLDVVTEQQVQKNLEQIATDRTTIVIAHRLSTIKDADKILVIKDGEIVEQGHFSALIESSVIFKSLWDTQQKSEQYLTLGQ